MQPNNSNSFDSSKDKNRPSSFLANNSKLRIVGFLSLEKIQNCGTCPFYISNRQKASISPTTQDMTNLFKAKLFDT
jgi:hypothetical protein